MNQDNPLPLLITFDGEARSGKGTIVQGTKDYIRDKLNKKVMLIDAGQVFRVLVVGAKNAGVDLNNPTEIDAFLGNDEQAEQCVQLVKDVYNMTKDRRDSLLYTNKVSENSAKIGSRPLSQNFKDNLLKKWLRDARTEGYEIVLLDGRALEEVGNMLEAQNLCSFRLGFYFVCDPYVGARRTLGFASSAFEDLNKDEQARVTSLAEQIKSRNIADQSRQVQPIKRPMGPVYELPTLGVNEVDSRTILLIDTSADMRKSEMIKPVIEFIEYNLVKNHEA